MIFIKKIPLCPPFSKGDLNDERRHACRQAGATTSGQIEIVVLGVIFLMSIFVFSMAHKASIEHKITRSRLLELQMYFFARAGVECVLSAIENDTTKIDTFSEAWGNHPENYQKRPIKNGFFEVINGSNPDMFGAGDEEFKININYADKNTMVGLFSTVVDSGEAKTLAETILKYRGEEDGQITNQKGKEEDRKKTFGLVEELLLIPEISEDLYAAIKDYITVYGVGKININTVNDEVMKGLGLTDGLIGKINDYRKGVDGTLGTEDDRVFDTVGTIGGKLAGYISLTPKERAKINAVKKRLGVRSDNFSFTSYGWIDGHTKKSIKVVAAREKVKTDSESAEDADGKKELKIKYWYEE
ncbi:MAG: hypothetical protein ABII25_05290 [bacterium]